MIYKGTLYCKKHYFDHYHTDLEYLGGDHFQNKKSNGPTRYGYDPPPDQTIHYPIHPRQEMKIEMTTDFDAEDLVDLLSAETNRDVSATKQTLLSAGGMKTSSSYSSAREVEDKSDEVSIDFAAMEKNTSSSDIITPGLATSLLKTKIQSKKSKSVASHGEDEDFKKLCDSSRHKDLYAQMLHLNIRTRDVLMRNLDDIEPQIRILNPATLPQKKVTAFFTQLRKSRADLNPISLSSPVEPESKVVDDLLIGLSTCHPVDSGMDPIEGNALQRQLSVSSSEIYEHVKQSKERNTILLEALLAIKHARESKSITEVEKTVLKSQICKGENFDEDVLAKLTPSQKHCLELEQLTRTEARVHNSRVDINELAERVQLLESLVMSLLSS